jgi:hypothetical protein
LKCAVGPGDQEKDTMNEEIEKKDERGRRERAKEKRR